MLIKDLNLTGFKKSDERGLDLGALPTGNIAGARAENKRFLFHAILGIIYGLSAREQENFRAEDGAKVLTGRLTIVFGDSFLHIERDFGTGIVAVLSQRQGKYKPVFQGKDLPGKQTSRPYLDILSSFFTITDKYFIIELCSDEIASNQNSLEDLLDLLHLFLRPRFKSATVRRLIGKCEKLLNREEDLTLPQSVDEKIDLLQNFEKLQHSEKSVKEDISRYHHFWNTLNKNYDLRSNTNERLKQRFPLIYHMDAREVRQEVRQLLTFRNEEQQLKNQLDKIRQRIKKVDDTIQNKLIVYADLPDSFEQDFHHYQRLSMDVAQIKNEYDRYTIEAGKTNAELRRWRRWEKSYYIAAVALGLLTGLIFFTASPLWSLPVLAVLGAGGFLFFRKMKNDRISHMDYIHSRQDALRKQIQEQESEINELRHKSFLLDDLDLIDEHIEKFKQYRKILNHKEELEKQKTQLKRQLNAPRFLDDQAQLEKKYSRLINLQRDDLLKYLEDFEAAQEAIHDNIEFKENSARLDPVRQTINMYDHLLTQIVHAREEIKKHLDMPDLDNNTEGYLKRAYEERDLLENHRKMRNTLINN